MKSIDDVGLEDVKAVYDGAEGDLWELIMGEQIHVGGFKSSTELATRSGIGAGQHGVDLCCCNGAGMRFLVQTQGVASMTGVDATPTVVQRGQERCQAAGIADRVRFELADVCDSGLPAGEADFVWGEDAWCYVEDKPKLIAEAVRIVRPGGIVAFTDWVEGPTGLTDDEATRFLRFMKFPTLCDIDDYRSLLQQNGCEVVEADDTNVFAAYMDLYLTMIDMQFTYDAMKILGFDQSLMAATADEMVFLQGLAHAGKITQGRFIARAG